MDTCTSEVCILQTSDFLEVYFRLFSTYSTELDHNIRELFNALAVCLDK